MIVSISQPTLFPWLGYFNIIKNSDIFVFLDNVKFEKRSWQMRNRIKNIIKGEDGETWIRIPTRLDKTNTLIKDVLIDNSQDWKKQHINAFTSHYGNGYEEIDFLKNIFSQNWDKLADFEIEFITNCCKYLGISTKLLRASNMRVEDKKSYLLLNICKKLNATEYLTTIGAKEYLENDSQIFEKSNIKIRYHNYIHPIYLQRGNIFIKNLSVLDLLFNEKENSKKFV